MLVFALFIACGNPSEPDAEGIVPVLSPLSKSSQHESWQDQLGPADLVGAADWTGDGMDERVRFLGEVAHWSGGTVDLGGAPQVIRRVVLPEGERLLVGSGMHRGNRTSPARLWSFGPEGAQMIWENHGVRNQIADVRVWGGQIYLSRFIGQKEVSGGFLVDGHIQEVHGGGLATQQLPLGADRLIVGRVYGSKPRSDGDLRLVQGSKTQTLPSLRGVRTLTLANLDADEDLELLVGDGWHYAYGQQAVGRLFLLDGPDWKNGRTLAILDGEYSARSIEVASELTGGDPSTSGVLVSGTKQVHFFTRDALGGADRVLGPTTETANAGLIRTPKGLAAWIAGKPNSRLVGLGGN